MTRVAAAVLLALVLAACADQAPDAARRTQARARAQEALTALAAGDAATAANAFADAMALAPDEPVLPYDRGVALERTGERDAAADAYGEALRAASGDEAVGADALFNLGSLRLAEAWGAAAVLDPVGLRAALPEPLRESLPVPDGDPLEGAAAEVRLPLAQRGLAAAKEAVQTLRDLVRGAPDDADAVQNLVLAQVARRALERFLEDLEREGSPEDQQGEDGEQEPGDQEGQQGESGEEQQQPDGADGAEQQEPEGAGQSAGDTPEQDEQAEKEGASASSRGEDGEGAEQNQEESAAAETTETPEERAERALERLLESAAQRVRAVREHRASRAQRTKVERDW